MIQNNTICDVHHNNLLLQKYGLLGCNTSHVVWRRPSALEEHIASVFRVEEQAKLCLLPVSAGFLPGLYFDCKDRGRNVRLSLNYMACQPQRLYSSYSLRTSNLT
jgi:hypothetical protein